MNAQKAQELKKNLSQQKVKTQKALNMEIFVPRKELATTRVGDFRIALAKRIEDRVLELGLCQSDAAQAMGVTQPRTSMIMNGNVEKIGADTLIKLVMALYEVKMDGPRFVIGKSKELPRPVTDTEAEIFINDMKFELARVFQQKIDEKEIKQDRMAKALGIAQTRVSFIYSGNMKQVLASYILQTLITMGYNMDIVTSDNLPEDETLSVELEFEDFDYFV